MRKLLWLMIVSLPAFGQYAQRQATVFASSGKPAKQASVQVCAFSDSTCVTPITIYSSSTGAAQSNPFSTDVVGNYAFYQSTGYYTVKETYQGASYIYPISIGDTAHKITYVDQYTSLQAAITASCNAGGGLVFVPAGTYTQTAADTLCSGLRLHGVGPLSVISFAPSGSLNDAIVATSFSNIEIDHLKITGSANVARLVSITGSTNVNIHDNTITGAALIPVSGPLAGVYINQSSDIWVERNVMSNGPSVSNAANNSEIMTWVGAGGNNRVHIRGNQISGGTTSISIIAFDCVDCDILNNQVDQNNAYAGGGNNGYGIACYLSALASVPRIRIEGNNVTNAAGNGIYLQTCDNAVVTGNTIKNVAQQQSDVSIPAAGITVNGCTSCVVTSNTIDTSGKDGIAFAATGGHNLFSNNTIKSASQYGINIRSISSDNTFSGNNISTTTNEGIVVLTGATQTRTAITGNTVNASSRSGINIIGGCISCDISRNIVSNFPAGFYGIISQNASTVGTKIDGNVIDNVAATSVGGGIDLNLGTNYTVNDNMVRNLTTQGIIAEAGVVDSIIAGNLVKGVAGTGILTSGAARSQVINNKLLSNGTNLTNAATDLVCGNGLSSSTSFTCKAAIVSSGATGGVGYTTGAGCAVTQATNKSTAVTCTGLSGAITLNNANLAATTSVGFTVTDGSVVATDTIIVNIGSGATPDSYVVTVDAIGSGTFRVSLRNYTAGGLAEALVLNFSVIKGVTS